METNIVVPFEIAERLYLSALYLRDFISMQPANTPVLWVGDGKSKVIDMPHFKLSCDRITEYENFYSNAKQS